MNSKNHFNWSFILLIVIITCFLIHSETTICLAQSPLTVEQLINDLACASCHRGIPIASEIREKTPDLSYAGLRYNPAYLFDYLQNPTKIRQHIGYSRMPNFNFREKESLALVRFLETQSYVDDKWPDFPSGLNSSKHKDRAAKAILIDSLECVKCHELEGNGKNTSTDLTTVGYRLNRQWLGEYLVAPYIFDGPNTKMPSYFYQLASRKGKFIQMLPQAAETIKILVTYLFSLNKDKQIQLQRAYEKAKKAYPDVNAEMGKKIFRSQNCVACHKHALVKPWQEYIAPDLSIEGARVKKEWLTAYLQKPRPIRPFGFYPGSGSRMPDFGLSDEEVDLLSDYLSKQTRASNSNTQIFRQKRLSAFSMQKARRILRTKLSCLGCHQLRDEGGRIGPNLSGLKSRLQPAFVYQFIQGPKEILPQTIMPKIIMPPKTSELIVNFLLQQEDSTSDSNYLSLTDNPLHFYQGPEQSFSLYVKYCASCHGVDGDGKGYNAKYLPTAPTNYSDRTYMSTRSDDTLFDGIFSGGYILNKSHLMPPWGHTLERSEIRQLVAVLRGFCQCQGPAWSRDSRKKN